MNLDQLERLEYLFFQYCNASISKEEMDQLNTFMLESEYIRCKYFEFLKTELAISHCLEKNYQTDESPELLTKELQKMANYEKAAPTMDISKETPPRELIQNVVYPLREKRKVSKFQIVTLVASVAAALFIALLVKFTSEQGVLPIAKVSDGVNTKWLSASGQISIGSHLYPGPLTLEKGVAQIALDCGARVLLQAPVKVDLETSSQIYLESGRLVANIEQSTDKRFVVRTANSTVVDYGTEFGVQVDQAGQLYTHVFKGNVELRQGSDPLKFENTLRLKTGQSGSINLSGELVRVADKPQQFFRSMPTPYELAVMKTQPLYYWRFDRDQDGTLQNERDAGLNDACQLIGSVGYTEGRDLGGRQPNIALQLTGGENYTILRDCTAEADNADSLAIAMWVRPETHEVTPRDKVIMRVRRGDELGMGHRSTILFDYVKKQFLFYVGHGSENPKDPSSSSDTGVSSGTVELDAWHHVAVTYTNSKRRMNLYVDGQLEASKTLPDTVRLLEMDTNKEPYRWLVGYGKTSQTEDINEANFIGSVDEISQYNRELSAEEVRMLYEAAQGRSND